MSGLEYTRGWKKYGHSVLAHSPDHWCHRCADNLLGGQHQQWLIFLDGKHHDLQ